MDVSFRSGKPENAEACGQICYEAFKAIAQRHNFPPDIPNPEVAVELMSQVLSRHDIYSVIAEVEGQVAGSNFLWEQRGLPE